jgi:hypothetical protein
VLDETQLNRLVASIAKVAVSQQIVSECTRYVYDE